MGILTEFQKPSSDESTPKFRKVAVIGGGASGLVAAKELRQEGHNVVIFERLHKTGGIWNHDPVVESDLLGLDPCRKIVHSSLYDSLRTNLPRQLMGFRSFPFTIKNEGGDTRRFPGHQEVSRYLHDFAEFFKLKSLVRFETEVFDVHLSEKGDWIVKSRSLKEEDRDCDVTEIYDAVVVCNGHHTQPRIVEIPGIDAWPGKKMHSHSYRVPEIFKDQVVVIVGNAASGIDISRDIHEAAKEVHIASKSATNPPKQQFPYENMWIHSWLPQGAHQNGTILRIDNYLGAQIILKIERAHDDGRVVFQDGSSVLADFVLYCTGYNYDFSFLKIGDIVTVDDSRVGPLYKQVFPPSLAPFLSFIGLPWKIAPFIMFELQSKWVAGVLSGRISLPSELEMMEDVNNFYSKLEADGYPKRYTHNAFDYQFEYDDWLASECGCLLIEEWRKEMFKMTWKNIFNNLDTYRDEWDDHEWILQAEEEFYSVVNTLDSSIKPKKI